MRKEPASDEKTKGNGLVLGGDLSRVIVYAAAVMVLALGLYASSLHSYILFHSLIEITTIAIAFTLFTLTWHARRFLTGGFLKALGIGYGLIALVDLLHSLAYKGMGVFPGYGANLPTQLWIVARYLQALLLCLAPLFARRDINEKVFFGVSLAAVSATTGLVFSGAFPDCFIEGIGLTPFKIVSEYVISLFLLLALFLFIQKRQTFNDKVFKLIIVSILCTIGSELAFTSYLSVYGPANMAGHFLKLASFYLIYRALVVTGFKEPFELIFHDLKQAEHALTSEREFSRCLLESMADGVVACEAEGILALFNRTAREWHGLDPLRLPPEEWARHYDLFRPDGITPLPTEEIPLARAFQGEVFRNAGMAIRAKGQPIRFILANGSVIQNEAGQKLGAVVVMRDNTELRRAEEQLRRANEELERRVEERTAELELANSDLLAEIIDRKQAETRLEEQLHFLQQLLDSIPIPVYYKDVDGIYLGCNAPFETLVGMPRSDIVGETVYEILPKERADIHHEMDLDLLRHPGIQTYEVSGIYKDGKHHDVIFYKATFVDESDRVAGIVGASIDITERKKIEEALRDSEELLRITLENILDPVFITDDGGRFTFICANVLFILGYTVEEVRAMGNISALLGEGLFDLEELEKQGEIRNIDCVIASKDGSRKDYLVNVRRVSIKEGAILYVCRNITERKRAEEEVRKLNEELEERVADRTRELQGSQGALMNIVEDLNEKTSELEAANEKLRELDRLKSMFIASMSHELRTPLNSIIGFSSILHDEWLGSVNIEQKENLAIILQSGRHLLNLINDVIDVSKIEAGKIESLAEEFDLRDLIDDAVKLIGKELEEKGLVLRVTSTSQLMFTDRRRLMQCVLNLLSNAGKYTERGSVTVETRIVQSAGATQDAGVAEISVTDTGIGIKEEEVQKLFQPFVRLGSHLVSTVPGTGLGLYLSSKLAAEVLKGDILVSSEYGRGSRFTLRVPVRLP